MFPIGSRIRRVLNQSKWTALRGTWFTTHMKRIWRGARERLFRGIRPPWLFRWHDGEFATLIAIRGDSTASSRFVVRWVGPEEMDLLLAVRPRRATFESLFARGHRCAVGFDAGSPVSMNWLTGQRVHVSRTNAFAFDVGEGGAWSFGDFVREDCRRRGYFRAHLAGLLRLLREEGKSSLFCAMFHEDRRSVEAHVKAGYQVFSRVRSLRVAGMTVHFVNDYRADKTFVVWGVLKGAESGWQT